MGIAWSPSTKPQSVDVAKLVNHCYSAPRGMKEQMGIRGPLGCPRRSEEMEVCLCTLVPDGATPTLPCWPPPHVPQATGWQGILVASIP